MHATLETPRSDSPGLDSSSPVDDTTNIGDEERGLGHRAPDTVPLHVRTTTTSLSEEETELRTRPNSIASSTGAYIKRKTSQIFEAVTSASQRSNNAPIAPKLAALVDAYAQSAIAADIKSQIEQMQRATQYGATAANGTGSEIELPDIAAETTLLRGRKRASWGTQFRILSGRAFKNLYRDPALLTAHYTSSIVLACESAFIFHSPSLTRCPSGLRLVFPQRHVCLAAGGRSLSHHALLNSDDISGFQNRLGWFFPVLGFRCVNAQHRTVLFHSCAVRILLFVKSRLVFQ